MNHQDALQKIIEQIGTCHCCDTDIELDDSGRLFNKKYVCDDGEFKCVKALERAAEELDDDSPKPREAYPSHAANRGAERIT